MQSLTKTFHIHVVQFDCRPTLLYSFPDIFVYLIQVLSDLPECRFTRLVSLSLSQVKQGNLDHVYLASNVLYPVGYIQRCLTLVHSSIACSLVTPWLQVVYSRPDKWLVPPELESIIPSPPTSKSTNKDPSFLSKLSTAHIASTCDLYTTLKLFRQAYF